MSPVLAVMIPGSSAAMSVPATVTWRLLIASLLLACIIGAIWPLLWLGTPVEYFMRTAAGPTGTGVSGEVPSGLSTYAVSYFAAVLVLVVVSVVTGLRLVFLGVGLEARLLALFVSLLCLSEIAFFNSQFRSDRDLAYQIQVALHLLAASAFYQFSAHYSRGLQPGAYDEKFRDVGRLRTVMRSPLTLYVGRLRTVMRSPVTLWGLAAVVAGTLLAFDPDGNWILLPALMAMMMVLILIWRGIRYLRSAYRTASKSDRRRIAWLVHGMVLAFWAVLLVYVLPEFYEGWAAVHDGEGLAVIPGPTLAGIVRRDVGTLIPVFLIVGSVAVSVFYSGAIDPELVLKRTTVYGALAVMFLFVFAGIEGLVSELVERSLGLPGLFGSALVGGFLALVIVPLRKRFSRLADRLMPRTVRSREEVERSGR